MKADIGCNYSYLYGLSDFWVTMFEDPELMNRVLESSSVSMSDVYSRFLQLSSTKSLDDIAISIKSDIQLLTLTVSQISFNSDFEFELSKPVTSAKVISDRPFLPLKSLEEGVDFLVKTQMRDGRVVSTLTLSKPLSTYQFPYRVVEGGKYEVALWASDVTLDEQLISKVFADVINIDPDLSTNTYKDYVRGLYFLYTNGPNIELMSRGMSLAIGVPLSRTNETVLLTTQDSQSGKWIVVTDRNSYTLPYNISPTVVRGQVLKNGDSLSKIIEIQDYKTNSDWWLNVFIPKEVLPAGPLNPGGGGTAIPGSDIDYLMRTFLKTHTFIVQVNWQPGYNISNFDNLREIISKVKPSYTIGVYAWKVPLGVDEGELVDEKWIDGSGVEVPLFEYEAVNTNIEIIAPSYIYKDGSAGMKKGEAFFIHGNTDPDWGVTVEDCVTVDPDFVLTTDMYLGVPGSEVTTSYSKLLHLYNATESEIKTKLDSLSITHGATLPDVFGLDRGMVVEPVLFRRTGISLPPDAEEGYNTADYIQTNNLFNQSFTGWELESYRYYIPAPDAGDDSYMPVRLVFTRQAPGRPVYNVSLINEFGLSESSYERIKFPIQKEELFEIVI